MHDIQRALQKEAQIDPAIPQQLFHLDPDGCLRWRVARQGARRGGLAGTQSGGYRRVRFGGHQILAHRVVWVLFHGRWPRGPLDHVDGDRLNNRISNLREATFVSNGRNMKRSATNTSGVTGVRWCSRGKRWLSRIRYNGRHYHLGYFDSLLDAVSARKSAERKLGFHPNHGRG